MKQIIALKFINRRHNVKKWCESAVLQRKWKSWVISAVRFLLVVCICFTILFPMISKVTVAFMQENDLYDPTVKYVPKNFTLGNFIAAFKGLDYIWSILGSCILSGGVALLTLTSTSLVGYGFARFNFPLKRFWFGMVILMLLIPPQTIMVPLYMQFKYYTFGGLLTLLHLPSINLLTTISPILLMSAFCVGLKDGLYIYLMRQSFRSVPKELEEAAYIDGADVITTFRQVVLPSVRPMMIAVFLFAFVWQWTDTLYTTMFCPTSFGVLSTRLSSLANARYSVYWLSGGTMTSITPGFTSLLNNAGCILVILPLLIVYLLCQRYFIEGIERSGITG